MEKFLASILASFVAPQNLNQVMANALKEIGQHLALNRSYMVERHPNEDVLDNTHEWCSHGIAPRKHQLQGIPMASLPEWMEPLKSIATTESIVSIRFIAFSTSPSSIRCPRTLTWWSALPT